MSETTQVAQQVPPAATQPQEPEKDQATGKYVYSYQPKDAEGQPIGRPYRFLYADQGDLVQQLTAAKENGDRFIHEVKSGKRQLQGEQAKPAPEYKPAAESADEADRKRREEFRRTAEQEFGAPLDDVRDRLKRGRDLEEYTTCNSWVIGKESQGYYICPENTKAIAEYMAANKLAYTYQNLDLVHDELKQEGRIIERPAPQTDFAPAPAGDSQDGTQPPKQAAPPKASTGIVPGQFAGTRREASEAKPPLTAERYRQINRMSRDDFNRLKRTNAKEYDAFIQMRMPKPAA